MKRLWKRRFEFIGKQILIITGVVIIAFLIWLLFNHKKAEMDWQEVDFSTDIEGIYVNNVIPELYGWYCELSEDDVPKNVYYYIMTPDSKIMGIRFEGNLVQKAELLMEKFTEYDNGEIDEQELLSYTFAVEGRIEKMGANVSTDYYKEGLGWEELSQEQKETVLFYYIDAKSKEQIEKEMENWGIIIVLICIFPLGFLINSLFDGKRKLRQYLKKSTNRTELKERLGDFFENSEIIHGLWLDEKYIAGLNLGTVEIVEISQIVWAYGEENVHRINGIRIYREHALHLKTADGRVFQMELKKTQMVDEAVEYIKRRCPWIVAGYSDRLKQLYYNDRERFLDLAYNEYMQVFH